MHAFKSRHFLNMIGYFVVAAAAILLLGFNVTAGSFLAGLGSAAIIGGIGLIVGLGITIALRAVFGLMQTGRIIQYLCFWAGTWLGLSIASFLIPALVVGSAGVASLAIFALAFGAATLTGEVPWKGRTWLPMRMPKR